MRRLHREPYDVVELGELAQPEERRGILTRPVHFQPHYRHDGLDIVAAHLTRGGKKLPFWSHRVAMCMRYALVRPQ